MKDITYNFLTGLKELSKKYDFDGFLYADISPSYFTLHNDDTEFYIHTKAETFTAMMICNLLDDMEALLKEVKYPSDLKYSFSISSNEGIIYNLFNDSYAPIMVNRQPNKIEFPCDNIKEEQLYVLSVDRGEIRLEKYNDDDEECFKDNPEVIDFLNTFIDNKIPTPATNITFTKEEYNTLTSIVFLAEESMLELAEKYPNPIELEQLDEQKQHIAEIVRKVKELTNNK